MGVHILTQFFLWIQKILSSDVKLASLFKDVNVTYSKIYLIGLVFGEIVLVEFGILNYIIFLQICLFENFNSGFNLILNTFKNHLDN